MSIYRQYFKEKKVWVIRKSRLLVANFLSMLEGYYSTSYSWLLEIVFALILSFSFQYSYLQTENSSLFVYQIAINTAFWFFFLKMISKYLRGKRMHNELFSILGIIGLYLLLWIPIGLDLTDEGWRLEAAYALWNFPELYTNKSSVVGSDLILGIWQKIGPHQLMWHRLGFAAVILIISTYTYKLLRLFYTTNTLAILLIISVMHFLTNVRNVPDYNNLGIMFLLGGAYHLTRSERTNRLGLHAAVAGVFLSLAVLCNFSLIIFMLVFPAYNLFFRKKISAGYFSLSFIASAAALWGVMMLMGVTDAYLNEIGQLFSSLLGSAEGQSHEISYHSSSYLLERYLKDAKTLGLLSLIDMGILFAGTMLLPRIHRGLRILVFIACYSGIWLISADYSFEFVVTALLLALLVLSIFIQNVQQKNFRAWFWAIAFFFLTFLGSNNGAYAITFTGGTILLVPIILITLKSRIVTWLVGSFSLRFHTIGAFLFILIFSYWSKPGSIYREMPASELSSSIQASGFFGIFTTEKRANATDLIMLTLNKEVKETERVLFVNNIATFEYMSSKSYPMYWHVNKDNKKEKAKRILSDEGPDFLLINHKNPRAKEWPQTESALHKMDRESYQFYMRLANSENFNKVAGNELFSLYKKN